MISSDYKDTVLSIVRPLEIELERLLKIIEKQGDEIDSLYAQADKRERKITRLMKELENDPQ